AKRTERSPRSSVRSQTAHCRSVAIFVTRTPPTIAPLPSAAGCRYGDLHVCFTCRRMRGGPRARRHHLGRWHVLARVERFTEPALLLLLRERPTHGYDLLERLPESPGAPRAAGELPARPRAAARGHRGRDRASARQAAGPATTGVTRANGV